MATVEEYFAHLGAKFEKARPSIVEAVMRTAKTIANDARSNDTYKDRTHHLRNSIAAVTFDRGNEVGSDTLDTGGSDGGKGAKDGINRAREVASEDTAAIVGVVTAAAPYARHVEAKGFNVLSANVDKLHGELERNVKAVVTDFINDTNK